MKQIFILSALVLVYAVQAQPQITERERPEEWDNLVSGGRFLDRFLPIPTIGELNYKTWGADDVIPRYTDNGIEEKDWSYWGGNILKGDDGKYHLFVCRWREDAQKGHMEWRNSLVVHAVSDNSFGPFKLVKSIGNSPREKLMCLVLQYMKTVQMKTGSNTNV